VKDTTALLPARLGRLQARQPLIENSLEPARALIDEAIARVVESSHVPTQSNPCYFKALLETLRGDSDAAASVAEVIVRLGRQHGLALYLTWGTVLLTWARARLGGWLHGALRPPGPGGFARGHFRLSDDRAATSLADRRLARTVYFEDESGRRAQPSF
jgi:hypothetical protein